MPVPGPLEFDAAPEAARSPELDRLARLAARLAGVGRAWVVTGLPPKVRGASDPSAQPPSRPGAPGIVALPIGWLGGHLVLADDRPKAWTEDERAALAELIEAAAPSAGPVPTPEPSRSSPFAVDGTLEQHHADLAELMPQMAWIADASGRISYFNRRWLEYTGMAPGDCIGLGWLEAVHPDDREFLMAAWNGSVGEGRPYKTEARVRRADGAHRWFLNQAVPLKDPAGRVSRWIGTNTDIDDKRHTEMALAEADDRLKIALTAARMVAWDVDLAAGRVTCTEGAEHLFGITEGSSEDYRALIHPDDRPEVLREAYAAIERGAMYCAEYRVCRPGAPDRWVATVGQALLDADGRPARLIGVTLDVDDRRRAVMESERLLGELAGERALVEAWLSASPVALAFLDTALRFVRINAAQAKINGRPAAEHLGRTLREILPGWADRIEPLFREVMEKGRPLIGLEFSGETNEPGVRHHVLNSLYPVYTEEGRLLGVGSVSVDVGELKRTQAKLREAVKAAESALRTRDRFLAAMSHELRTPLTPALASIAAVTDDPECPPSLRETLETIRRNIELEARLIDDLLEIGEGAEGELRLRPRPVDAHGLVVQAVAICRDAIAAAGIRADLELAAESHHIEADPARVQQIIWNLVKNAVKFTPEGGRIVVRTRNHDAGPSGSTRLVVEVEDSGIGLEPGAIGRIFEMMGQYGGPSSRPFGGRGLGLAVSRTLAERHGGTLTARSAGADRGSTFTLDLPTVPDPAEGISGEHPAYASPDPGPLRILLVEDDPDTRRVIARLLARSGHRVATASGVGEAIRLAEDDGPFDLLLSDVGLPDGSGLEVMRHLRGRLARRGISLSGFGREEDYRRSAEAGFDEHLVKPVNYPDLKAVIGRLAAGD